MRAREGFLVCWSTSRWSLPLILMHTRALMTNLFGGHLLCKKDYKVWYIFKIKVNACILIHPINNYNFLGGSFKNAFFNFYWIFFLIPQVTKFFDFTPIFSTKNNLLSSTSTDPTLDPLPLYVSTLVYMY